MAAHARWWLGGAAFACAVVVATWVSSTVALPVTNISPVFLPLGLGVAVLARWGRSLWPAFVLGDVVGQLVAGERLPTWIALSLACHLATVLIGATLIQRQRAWIDGLGSAARYLAITAGLAVLGAALGIVGLEVHGFLAGSEEALTTFAFWALGDFGGYLVLGAAVIVWSGPGAIRELRRPLGWAMVLAVCAASAALVVDGSPWWGLLAMLLAGATSARLGVVWGTAAMAATLAGVVIASVEGLAPFSGATPPYQAFNAMLAVAILGGTALLVGGYREQPASTAPRVGLIVAVLGAAVAITATSDFALLAMSLESDAPFALSAFLFAGATFGVALVRLARPPERAPAPRALALAALAGLLNGLSFAAYFAAVPRIGAVPASALLMTYPVGIVALVALRRRRAPAPLTLLVILPIVIGAAVTMVGVGATGLAFALASPLLFAGALLVADAALESLDVVGIAVVSLPVAGVACAVLGVAVEGVASFGLSPQYVGLIGLAAIGGTLVPQITRLWALPTLGPVAVGACASLGLVATAALSLLVLGDSASRATVLGLVLIAAGCVLTASVATRRAAAG